MNSNNYKYRWDIQGLRAIAVLAVVIFHINPYLLPGGYIGVDIFFVISGYLIIGFIWRDLMNGNFNLIHFYTKRIRRLFPALFVMVLASCIAAYFILLPDEAPDFLKSLISTLFNVSNFYFYSQADYFNSSMKFAPLLHTWSLSVEEQFYLVFPIILLFIFSKNKIKISQILLILTILFLLVSELTIYWDESLAFFSSPTRFFQFTIGGLIALNIQKNRSSQVLRDISGLIGLIIIFVSFFIYDGTTLFPGFNALLPTLGVSLILFANNQVGFTYLFLTNKLFKHIGNTSYSIYLWHWPLIVFYKLQYDTSLNVSTQVSLLLLSIFLGYISWKYIEQRTKFIQLKYTLFTPIRFSLVLSLLVSILSLMALNQVEHHLKTRPINYAQYATLNTDHFRAGTCFLTSKFNDLKYFDKVTCIPHDSNKKNYLLIGDSHAAHFYSALNRLTNRKETLSQVTASGCRPILEDWGNKRCSLLMKWAYTDLIVNKHFDTIILSARWLDKELKFVQKTVKRLLKYTDHVVILGRTIEYKNSLPLLLERSADTEDKNMLYKTVGRYQATLDVDTKMKTLFSMENVTYLSILNILCDEKGCKTLTDDNIPMAFDIAHFTEQGADYVLENIEKDIFTQ